MLAWRDALGSTKKVEECWRSKQYLSHLQRAANPQRYNMCILFRITSALLHISIPMALHLLRLYCSNAVPASYKLHGSLMSYSPARLRQGYKTHQGQADVPTPVMDTGRPELGGRGKAGTASSLL